MESVPRNARLSCSVQFATLPALLSGERGPHSASSAGFKTGLRQTRNLVTGNTTSCIHYAKSQTAFCELCRACHFKN